MFWLAEQLFGVVIVIFGIGIGICLLIGIPMAIRDLFNLIPHWREEGEKITKRLAEEDAARAEMHGWKK